MPCWSRMSSSLASSYQTEGPRLRRFGERFIHQTKGRWAGQLLEHQAWEVALTNELFLKRPSGERVYKEALIGVARKNGKSTLGSELGLYGLMGTPEQSPEVYAAAASRDQARVVFDQSRQMVDASPKLRDWLVPQRSVIRCRSNHGIFRVLASDAPLQYGLNPSMVIIDELWAHRTPELYYALTTGQLARLNPLVVSITTAGFDRSTICFELYERGRRLREQGGIEAMREEGFLFWWYEAPPGSDYTDASTWMAANPSSWITLEQLGRESRRLPESVFRRLHLNQWTEVEDAWIKPWQWDACRADPFTWDFQTPTWAGVDIGFKRDSAGIVCAQFHDDRLYVRELILLPEEQGREWGVADVRAVLATELAQYEQLREVAFDPWSFRESAELLLERGFPMVEFPQTSGRMSPASEGLYELVVSGRLAHRGESLFRSQVLAAVAAPTDRGGWKINKRRSLERIDATVALAMATDRAVTMHNVRPSRRTIVFA